MTGVQRVTSGLLDVLAVLAAAPDGIHGYAIVRAVRRAGGRARRSATIYERLGRMERAGWVTARWESEPAGGRPARREWTLTDIGRERARALLPRRERAA